MAENSQSLGRGQAPASATFAQEFPGPRNYTQLQQPPPMGQFEGSLGQYPHTYTMPVGNLEPGQRKISYDGWTAGPRDAQGYGGAGRGRHSTWPGLLQENWDGSDAERQSETKSGDMSHAQDTFDDNDIGSSVSTHCSAKPKINTGLISTVPSTTEIMDDHPSYHQSITAKEAERRLKMFDKDCCYLTRYSKANKCYVLSLFRKQWPDDAIEHLGIIIDDKGKYKIKGNKDKTFDGIGSLLLHYETCRISPGFPEIGQGYREKEFIKQQKEEKRREEEEKKRKEEEQNRLKELEEEHNQLLKKLQEAEQQKQEAENRRQAELKQAEDRRQAELQDAENRRQAELRDAEDRRQAELQAAEEKRLQDVQDAKRCIIL